MYNVIYTDPITRVEVVQRNVEAARVAKFIDILVCDIRPLNIRVEQMRQFSIGEWVVVRGTGELAKVERYMTEYPDQRWYWVRRQTPDMRALAASEFPDNATHYACMEIELDPASGDDFAEPPTVGNAVI